MCYHDHEQVRVFAAALIQQPELDAFTVVEEQVDGRPGYLYLARPDGLRLSLVDEHYKRTGRVRLGFAVPPDRHHDVHQLSKTIIGVSLSRRPRDAARAIAARLLPHAEADYVKAREQLAAGAQARARQEQLAEDLAARVGGAARRLTSAIVRVDWNEPGTDTTCGLYIDSGAVGGKIELQASGRIKAELGSRDPAFLRELANLIGRHNAQFSDAGPATR